ncbi:MAG: DedA family protein [candidate division KSB1 bacterium]|nr:DedA family protein [candidate division KSB1 bacterium]MDZ7318802.1 DedA family protein [candidate division KSB1 bacterium]MDZ7342292.1 DedA family protein [candidate division KSB1 bacterium]
MPPELFIEQYGYLALFVGTIVEGETVVVLAGFAAARGYLHWYLVILIAFLGTTLTDHSLFFLGRCYGQNLLAKRLNWKNQIDRIHRYLQRYQNYAILGFRFLYGMRMIAAFAIGTSKIEIHRFCLLNIFSSLLWAAIYASGGYMFGQALAALLGDIQRYQFKFMMGIIIMALSLWIYRRIKKTNVDSK